MTLWYRIRVGCAVVRALPTAIYRRFMCNAGVCPRGRKGYYCHGGLGRCGW